MNDQFKNRLRRTAALAFIALLIGATIGFIQLSNRNNATVIDKGTTPMAGVAIGGPFTLTDHNGNIVTEKSYSGQYKLVFFGFTNCPMVCPTGLQKMAKALDTLGYAEKNIQPILISVDPERDTPDVLKQYVNQFHPKLVGLTGTKTDIENVQKAYRVYSAKVQDDTMTDYTMDHSAFMYLMSPDGKLVSLYQDSDTAEQIAADIKKNLGI
jgi:protein SCO1